MTIWMLAMAGDSITYKIDSYFYQYFGVPTLPDPGSQTLNGIEHRGQFRPFKSSPKIIGANYAMSGTRLVSGTNSMTGIAGVTVDHLIPRVKANSIPRFTRIRGGIVGELRKYALFLLAGTNTDTADPAVHAANVGLYAAARKAAGWDYVLIGTLPSQTYNIVPNFETAYRLPYNATLRDPAWRQAHSVDGIIDFAADPEIGAVDAADNLTYFSDQTHPTSAGYAIMAARFGAEFGAFISGF